MKKNHFLFLLGILVFVGNSLFANTLKCNNTGTVKELGTNCYVIKLDDKSILEPENLKSDYPGFAVNNLKINFSFDKKTIRQGKCYKGIVSAIHLNCVCTPDTIPACKASFYYEVISPDSNTIGGLPKVVFHNTSTGNITSWLWTFSDGSTSSVQNPVITYNNQRYGDTLKICLNISSSKGCSDNICQTLFIYTPPPPPPPIKCQASFGYYKNDSLYPGQKAYQFTDWSQGNVVRWVWNFGDGTYSTERNPFHVFSNVNPGDSLTVCLTISTTDSCTSSICLPIINYVPPPPVKCQAYFGYYRNDSTFVGQKGYQFYDWSQGSIVSWLWNFGDGSYSSERNPYHVFSSLNPGDSIIVCLTINTTDSCTSNFCRSVVDYVPPPPPKCQANFGYYKNDSIYPGQKAYQFYDWSFGKVIKWVWSFDDSTYSYEQNPIHVFSSIPKDSATNWACLTIYTSDTCTSNICLRIIDYVPPPPVKCQANFSYYKNDSLYPGQKAYQFYDYSQGSITSWFWNFGDGTYSSQQSPFHIFNNLPAGDSIAVCLTITTSDSCSSSICITILRATPPPPPIKCQANFSYYHNDSISGSPQTYQFYDISQGNIVIWNWSFGDGTTAYDRNPVHTYNLIRSDSVNVCLAIYTSDSCISSICKGVFINVPAPSAVCKVNFAYRRDELTIKTNCNKATSFQLEITSITGQVKLNRKFKVDANKDEVEINVNKLADNSCYFVKAISDRNEVFYFKFIKR